MNKEQMDMIPIDAVHKLPSIRVDQETWNALSEVTTALPISKTNIIRMAVKHYCLSVLNGTLEIGKFKIGNDISALVSKGNGGKKRGK